MPVVLFPVRLIGNGWKWLSVGDDGIRKSLQILVHVLRDTLGNIVDRGMTGIFPVVIMSEPQGLIHRNVTNLGARPF